MSFRIKIENVVASTSLGVPIKLEKLVSNLDGVEYEPEQFPGLVYRIDDPRVTFLLFGSGKIICTGGRSINDVKRAVSKAGKKLKNIKKS
jgi:transcription initiation factor TFIID TATA-box-binding protein